MSNAAQGRFAELDGLRGLAAFSVFLSHSVGLLYESSRVKLLQASPARIFWDGTAAVDLFFALSGLVLALPYLSAATNPQYVQFCIRRIFRIYPAFWLALCISIVLRVWYTPSGMSGLSDWALTLWSYPLTMQTVIRHVPLVVSTNTRVIDPVVWSLGIEMRMSLVLPLVIVAFNYSRRIRVDIALVGASIALGAAVDALSFFPLFVLGAFAAKHLGGLVQKTNEMRRTPLMGLLCLGTFLYGNRWMLDGSSIFMQHVATAVGALIIMVTIVSRPTLRMCFSSRLARFAGHTSYSFYLIHLPILLFVTSRVYPATGSLALCCVLAAAFAYFFAFLTFVMVERPANMFGRSLMRGPIFYGASRASE